MEILVYVGIFAVVALVWAYLLHWYEQERAKEYAAAAAKLSLDYSADGNPVLLASLEEFPLFQTGYAQKLRYLIHGRTQDLDVFIFDFQYTTGGGEASAITRQTVICLDSLHLNLPHFQIRPRQMRDRLAKLVGLRTIDFAEYPEFANAFVVTGDDEETIRQVISPEVMDELQETPGMHLMGGGTRIVFYRPTVRSRGYQIRPFLEEAFQVYGPLKESQPREASSAWDETT